jgi:hypothetical protein
MSPSTTLRFEGDYAAIPERMREGIIRWAEEGIRPGSFLWSVIRNDLFGAFATADETNLALLPLYVRWFYWECPAGMCGSDAIAGAWAAKGGLKGRVENVSSGNTVV